MLMVLVRLPKLIQGSDAHNCKVEDVGSIADQVDALIEEERYRLPQDE